jgi:exodeoxyribonuclease VII small subunit
MNAKKKSDISIEAALTELNTLVGKMEKGNLSLEESLTCFERGISLTKTCQQTLSEAKQRVQILMEKNGAQTLMDEAHDESL